MSSKRSTREGRRYTRIRRIDGRHPLRAAAPQAHLDYPARRRHDAEVAYFNFDLAREMGLIPPRHPDELDPGLRRALLDTFALVIVNEYDYLNATPIDPEDLLPHSYMATRYLQLQHPDKRGVNSGDGRSVWNGTTTHRGVTWDISSCGTGVTRLCPATSENGVFYRTGNYISSYGCGTAALAEGMGAAVMSDVFHRNGIATERVLAVLALPSGLAINVRASRCLLRPSHFFVHLRQGNLEALRATVDFFIDRQVSNGDWPRLPAGRTRASAEQRYTHLAEEAARTFARVTATFESEYVFCWLDWDGDNVLADGSIIDYGSVRQFGLFHREYRFEDTDRMSTSIPEQRRKARYITQKYAQIRDYLVTGRKKPLRSYAHDPVLALFDREFDREMERRLLRKLGLEQAEAEHVSRVARDALARFERAYRSFERARSSRGPRRVADGLSWDAVFCMRDVLRELPAALRARWIEQAAAGRPTRRRLRLPAPELMRIALSDYASRRDASCTPWRTRRARELQDAYLDLLETVSLQRGETLPQTLARTAERAAVINHYARMTGDGVDHASQRLLRRRRQLGPGSIHRVIRAYSDYQDLDPDGGARRSAEARTAELQAPASRVLASMVAATREHRESL